MMERQPSRTALGAAGHRAAHQVLEGGGIFADPLALLFATTLLLFAAVLAGLLPARRASQVDPMVALRYE